MRSYLRCELGTYLMSNEQTKVGAGAAHKREWEVWDVQWRRDGSLTIKSVAHGGYLMSNPQREVGARARRVGPWEKWTFHKQNGPGEIEAGDTVTILSAAHGRFLAVHENTNVGTGKRKKEKWVLEG